MSSVSPSFSLSVSNLSRINVCQTGFPYVSANNSCYIMTEEGLVGLGSFFGSVSGFTFSPITGELFFASYGTHKIGKLNKFGITEVYAGTGASERKVGLNRLESNFYCPRDLAFPLDSSELYIIDCHKDIKIITKEGVVESFAGQWDQYGHKDGAKQDALFSNITSCSTHPISGELYVSDAQYIRKIDYLGIVSTIIGEGPSEWTQISHRSQLRFPGIPSSLCFAPDGSLYFTSHGSAYHIDNLGYVSKPLSNVKSNAIAAGKNGELYSWYSVSFDRFDHIAPKYIPTLFLDYRNTTLLEPESNIFKLQLADSSREWRLNQTLIKMIAPSLLVHATHISSLKLSETSLDLLVSVIHGMNPELPDVLAHLTEFIYLMLLLKIEGLNTLCKAAEAKLEQMLSACKTSEIVTNLVHIGTVCPGQYEILEIHMNEICNGKGRPEEFERCVSMLHHNLTTQASFEFILQKLVQRNFYTVKLADFWNFESGQYIAKVITKLYDATMMNGFENSSSSEADHLPKPNWIISSGSEKIECHSWIVAGRWPYFAKLLAFEGMEVTQRELKIDERIWNANVIRLFVKYLYTSQVEGITADEDKLSILKHAKVFQLVDLELNAKAGFERLIRHCKTVFFKSINLDTCINWYQHVRDIGAEYELEQVKDYIASKIPEIFKNEEQLAQFSQLPVQEQIVFLYRHHGAIYKSPLGDQEGSGQSTTD